MVALRLFAWFSVWIGGLVLAGSRYSECRGDEGLLRPDCDQSLEYLGWWLALFGLVMLARSLRDSRLLARWVE